MAQHDYIISNQTFPSYRNDHNNSLEAGQTKNSGATAPSTTYPYQWWYDTSTNILKIRNADDDAWINFATFDQLNDEFSLTVKDITVTGSGAIPSGTKMLFQQTNAPTGWTKDTTHNNKALRIVNGSVGTGGTNSFTNAFNSTKTVSGTTGTSSVTISGSTAGHTLTKAQLPNISASVDFLNRGGASASSDIIRNTTGDFSESAGANYGEGWQGEAGSQSRKLTLDFGSGQSHSHTISVTSGSHSHSFSDTFNLNVQYVDFIIATKD